MKKLTLALLLSSTLASAHLVEGGISGGGGNVINATPPTNSQDPREVRAIIRGSTHLLFKYLYAQYALYKAGSMNSDLQSLYAKFFDDDEDEVCEIAREIKINIPLDTACFDANHTAFDGSAFNPKERTICISANRIANNTTLREIPIQSAALMLHEFAEAYGLSDEQATLLQNIAINDLKNW